MKYNSYMGYFSFIRWINFNLKSYYEKNYSKPFTSL